MLIILCLFLSVVIGWIRGGELSNFQKLNFKKLWLLILAFALQFFIVTFGMTNNAFVLDNYKTLYMISYGLLIVYLIVNITNRQLLVLLAGVILNTLVFVSNNGRIPISVDGLKLAGLNDLADLVVADKLYLYVKLTENAKYGALSKIITLQKPFPYTAVVSIGDVLVSLGVFIFIQSVMLGIVKEKRRGIQF